MQETDPDNIGQALNLISFDKERGKCLWFYFSYFLLQNENFQFILL